MIAVDVSLLAYSVNRYAPEHRTAAGVLEGLANGDQPWAIPWPVIHEFIRFVTHPHAVARPLRVRDARTFIEELLQSHSLRLLVPTDRHARVLGEVLDFLGPESGFPAGLETAVVLREHGVRDLFSSDAAMRRYSFLAIRDPVHGELAAAEHPARRRYRRLNPRRET